MCATEGNVQTEQLNIFEILVTFKSHKSFVTEQDGTRANGRVRNSKEDISSKI